MGEELTIRDEALVDRLSRVTADLDGYIERRAFEVAAPMVEMARALLDEVIVMADERVQRAEGEVQHKEDVISELRRIVDIRDRRIAEGSPLLGAAFFSAFRSGRWREITGAMEWQERRAAAAAVEAYAERVKMNPPVDRRELRWWQRPVGA